MVDVIYRFEQLSSATAAEWSTLPLAARRALDHAGVRLSLTDWQAMSAEQKLCLATLGHGDVVPCERVHELLAPYSPPLCAAFVEPKECPADPETLEACGELRAAWPHLSPFGRYTLVKVLRSRSLDGVGRSEALREVMAPACALAATSSR